MPGMFQAPRPSKVVKAIAGNAVNGAVVGIAGSTALSLLGYGAIVAACPLSTIAWAYAAGNLLVEFPFPFLSPDTKYKRIMDIQNATGLHFSSASMALNLSLMMTAGLAGAAMFGLAIKPALICGMAGFLVMNAVSLINIAVDSVANLFPENHSSLSYNSY